MSKVVSLRLPEDIIQSIEEIAAKEGRSKSQVIIRALRFSAAQEIAGLSAGAVKLKSSYFGIEEPATVSHHADAVEKAREISELAAETRYRKCQHGDNEYTCPRIACKLKSGRRD